MKVNGQPYRSIWLKPDEPNVVQIIDQRHLPHRFVIEDLRTVEQAADAIQEMHVRGAPLIGATAAFLASEDARYITGQVLFVDGGTSARIFLGVTETKTDLLDNVKTMAKKD